MTKKETPVAEQAPEPVPEAPTHSLDELSEKLYALYCKGVETAGGLQCIPWPGLHPTVKAGWHAITQVAAYVPEP